MGVDDFSHRARRRRSPHARRAAKGNKHKDVAAYLESVQADERAAEPICGRRPRRAGDAQRPGRRRRRATVGGHLGHPVRPALGGARAPSSSTIPPASPTRSTRPTSSTSRRRCARARSSPATPATSPPSSRTWAAAPCSSRCRARAAPASSSCPSDESPNLNQMIEAVGRDGYIVAQEVLPEADEGDVRLFLMNGEPLVAGGHHAAFRRVNRTADRRSNMRVGGKAEPVKVDRRHARGRRGRPTQAHRRRHVPRRARHRRRQADGGQRVQPRRPRQLRDPLQGQVHRRGDRRARAEGRPPAPLRHARSTTPASPRSSALVVELPPGEARRSPLQERAARPRRDPRRRSTPRGQTGCAGGEPSAPPPSPRRRAAWYERRRTGRTER